MNMFMTRIFDLVKKKCRLAVLHDDMNIYRFMGHAQSMKAGMLEEKNKELKRSRSDEPSQTMSKRRFHIRYSPIVNKYKVLT